MNVNIYFQTTCYLLIQILIFIHLFLKVFYLEIVFSATDATIEMSNKMGDNGADAALVITPCYYKSQMTSSIFLSHFEKVIKSNIFISTNFKKLYLVLIKLDKKFLS